MKKIRAFYIKALVNAEVDFEYLTSEEQIELIETLIKDHHISFPNEKKELIIFDRCEYDGSLDF